MKDSARIENDPQVRAQVQEYLNEALEGPERGGVAGQVMVGPVVLEAMASKGWGVEFVRVLPSGARARARLTGERVSAREASAAISRLLQAA